MFQFVLSNLYRKSKYKKNVTNKVNVALKHWHWVQSHFKSLQVNGFRANCNIGENGQRYF